MLLLAGFIALVAIGGRFEAPATIVILAVRVFVGFRGNDWRRARLLKEGYKHMQRVDAENTDLALASESGLRCLECDKPYRLSDYRADAESIYCSFCNCELPRDGA